MGFLNLFRPKWKHSNADVRQSVIAEVKEPKILVEMIIRDPEWFVRHEAFGALRVLDPEQVHYHRLVSECTDEEIRRKVVKVMTDVAELERVSENDQYLYIRDAAGHRLEEIRSGIWSPAEEQGTPIDQ